MITALECLCIAFSIIYGTARSLVFLAAKWKANPLQSDKQTMADLVISIVWLILCQSACLMAIILGFRILRMHVH